MWVTLEVPHNEAGHEARTVRGRVTWIQRPRTVRELFQIGVELEVPGNVWGIAFPPADWFPSPIPYPLCPPWEFPFRPNRLPRLSPIYLEGENWMAKEARAEEPAVLNPSRAMYECCHCGRS